MGVLQRFERRLGGLVEGAFAKVFKGEVQPVEVAAALQRELDDKRSVVGPARIVVPNDFTVELGDADHERLAPWAEPLGDELAGMVREHAAEQGYSFMGPVAVRLDHVPELDLGMFRIRSTVSAGPIPEEQAAPAIAHARLQLGTAPGSAEFALEKSTTVIGRASEADVRLPDPGISRRHAEIRLEEGGYLLVDLGSTNGTQVNGTRVTLRRLAPGDRIELGSTVLVFRQGD